MGKSREGHGTATVAIFPEHESYHRILTTTTADDVPCNFQLTTFFLPAAKGHNVHMVSVLPDFDRGKPRFTVLVYGHKPWKFRQETNLKQNFW